MHVSAGDKIFLMVGTKNQNFCKYENKSLDNSTAVPCGEFYLVFCLHRKVRGQKETKQQLWGDKLFSVTWIVWLYVHINKPWPTEQKASWLKQVGSWILKKYLKTELIIQLICKPNIQTYPLSSRRPPGPPLRAPLVHSQVCPEAAQHPLQVTPLPLQLDTLLGHTTGLPAQLALHLPHPPHVLACCSNASPGTLLTQTGRWEQDHKRPLGATGNLQRKVSLQLMSGSGEKLPSTFTEILCFSIFFRYCTVPCCTIYTTFALSLSYSDYISLNLKKKNHPLKCL